MIEGVRLLPWLQEAAHRDRAAVAVYLDCEKCMRDQSTEARRLMGCGYMADAPLPAGRPPGYESDLTVCMGYSTSLPEVIETSRARLWWDKGALRDWCEDEPPTPALRIAIEEMEAQVHAAQSHGMASTRREAEARAAHDAHFRGKR